MENGARSLSDVFLFTEGLANFHRFLRLLLALSTHALLQRTSDKASFPSEDGIRRGQPVIPFSLSTVPL